MDRLTNKPKPKAAFAAKNQKISKSEKNEVGFAAKNVKIQELCFAAYEILNTPHLVLLIKPNQLRSCTNSIQVHSKLQNNKVY